jgi:hypothetical protein
MFLSRYEQRRMRRNAETFELRRRPLLDLPPGTQIVPRSDVPPFNASPSDVPAANYNVDSTLCWSLSSEEASNTTQPEP